ncbi:VWA domain-containing protein [Hyphomicrobium sp.]|uniref:vWA domain-containing protein n=1 Tax=Hyphomicrobium sp. TaxID=82 RepID=UPI0025C4B72D|nr:VWA domain-containing protein [Hyphomicrobium sp.]MCC7250490.1 VWA domain-containing protein [Hyphomicrobium sp.]
MRRVLELPRTVAVAMLAGTLATGAAHAEPSRSVALVLDTSGSMNALMPDGQSRMDAAKSALATFVGTLPPETRLALRAYGHQSPRSKKDCNDTSLLTPFDGADASRAAIVEKARALQPLGYTPITLSLTLAAKDLGSEESAVRTIVLVSDGKETCAADPCAAAKALADADAKLVVHTVGVGVDTVTRAQLQCIARMGRGTFFDANNTSELAKVLTTAATTDAEAPIAKPKEIVIKTPKPGKLKMKVSGHFRHDVLNAAKETVGSLVPYGEVELPPGIYTVTFGNGLWTGIEVKAGETTEIKPGYLEVQPIGSDFVYVLDPETGETVEEILGSKPRATLIPGHFDVKFGDMLWPGGAEVKPGETTTLRPGVIHVSSKATMYFIVKDLAGHQVDVGDSPGNTRSAVPPGKYVLELDNEKWIKSLTDNQRTMSVELGAGEELKVNVE